MWKLNEQSFEKKLNKIREKNIQKQYRQILKQEKDKFSNKKHVETSKIIAVYLIVLLNSIIIYSMTAMWLFQDLTYLGVLISDIAAQVLVYAIYCLKAYHGKKQEELLKFERDKFNCDFDEILHTGSDNGDQVSDIVESFEEYECEE